MTPEHYRGRYLFVCGLHRTGTSLLTRLLASHPEIDGITQAPVPENEGVFLQGAIPHTARHGIPGEYATDPDQHLVEGCAFDTLNTRLRIEHDWKPWFSATGSWRVEKSPVNLTRMRLYQQLFPLSQFVLILCHPEAMAAALAKWTDRSPSQLIDYALDAYDLAFADLEYIHAAMIVRYEDLVSQSQSILDSVSCFCDLQPVEVCHPIIDGNHRYRESTRLNDNQATRAQRYGYRPAMQTVPVDFRLRHPLREVREATQQPL